MYTYKLFIINVLLASEKFELSAHLIITIYHVNVPQQSTGFKQQ